MAKTKGSKKGAKHSSLSVPAQVGGDFVVLENKRRLQTKRIKRVSWRDEQIEGMSVSDVPEFTDPAILVVKEIVKICYTRDELIKLKEAPLSKRKPEFIESLEAPLDPERWPFDRKKTSSDPSGGDNANFGPGGESRRRGNNGNSSDPRERIRKENDGIVLSPQRRSFNSGCFVPVSRGASESLGSSGAPQGRANHRPHSPLGGKGDGSHMGIREIQPGARRIGSGRILRDTWDFDKSEQGDESYGGGFNRRERGNGGDEKYERRSFGRDFEITRDRGDRENVGKEGRRNNGGRFERRRISENREIEEPEWFSGGPMSQNDTIELRGFDDEKSLGNTRKKLSPSRLKRSTNNKKKESQQNIEEKEEGKEGKESGNRVATPQADAEVESIGQADTEKKATEAKEGVVNSNNQENNPLSSVVNDHRFNFDDILKCDTIPGLLSNGISADGDNAKSRFSRWFRQESPKKQESRRSSLHDEHNIIKGLLNDISEPSITIPGDSDAYFAPISPATNNNTFGVKAMDKQPPPINIIEMLQRGNQRMDESVNQMPPMLGKILSLDELEAKMRQSNETKAGAAHKPQQQKPDEEMTAAFKKLLVQAQTAGAHSVVSNGPMNKTQPMSLLEMLNHSQQQDEAACISAAAAHLLGTGGPISPNMLHPQQQQQHQSPHCPSSDLSVKLQQVQMQQEQKQQMEMLNKLINATVGQRSRTSPSLHHDVGGVQQQSRDLLSRPEAQAILQAMHQRIPSPRELQVHTQNILQRALIKKKLEEQQENYRKKQEMQRGQSPNPQGMQIPSVSKSIASPTPLAFTPTSVLRKMTAEKDDSKEGKVSSENKIPPGRPLTGMRPQPPQPQANPQWNTQFAAIKQPAGRPIVKANSYPVQTAEQFFSQHQQRLFSQQQQQPVLSNCQQPQQRKPANMYNVPPGVQTPAGGGQFTNSAQYPIVTNQQSQFGQQLTQQQLRAQHQHRPQNQGAGQQQQPTTAGQQPIGFQPQQQQMGAWQQLFNNAQHANRNNPTVKSLGDGDGNLSPTTTNQLARWFSPDLLERARGGELPSTAGLAQHAMSLEEIERQTVAPTVHN